MALIFQGQVFHETMIVGKWGDVFSCWGVIFSSPKDVSDQPFFNGHTKVLLPEHYSQAHFPPPKMKTTSHGSFFDLQGSMVHFWWSNIFWDLLCYWGAFSTTWFGLGWFTLVRVLEGRDVNPEFGGITWQPWLTSRIMLMVQKSGKLTSWYGKTIPGFTRIHKHPNGFLNISRIFHGWPWNFWSINRTSTPPVPRNPPPLTKLVPPKVSRLRRVSVSVSDVGIPGIDR